MESLHKNHTRTGFGAGITHNLAFEIIEFKFFSVGVWLERRNCSFDTNRKDQNFMSDKPLYVNLSIPKHRQLFNYVTMKL